jgi:RNA polymerase sigma-70 factor (ECF subfamily)
MFQTPLKHSPLEEGLNPPGAATLELTQILDVSGTEGPTAARCFARRQPGGSRDMERDDSAFEQLLAKYQGKVLGLCYAMLGDRALAEETAQEVFLRIWRGLGAFRGESSPSTWIYAIARNASLTARGRLKAAATDSLDDPDVLRRAHRHQLRQSGRAPRADVIGWLAELPEPQRQALTLFYLEEKSYDEVASALDVPMGTVKTWIHRGRRALAEKRLRLEAEMKQGTKPETKPRTGIGI